MTERRDQRLMLRTGEDKAAQAVAAALGDLVKGLKAITFYPDGHPLRKEILRRSYQSVISLMNGQSLCLLASRNGLSIAGRDDAVDKTPISKSLARELFSREVQRLTFLPDITADDFTQLLLLLATEPRTVLAGGGMQALLEKRGVRTVIANEINVSVVFTRRNAAEDPEAAVSTGMESKGGDKEGKSETSSEGIPLPPLPDPSLEELIDLMDKERDDGLYDNLAGMLAAKGQKLKSEGGFDGIFPVLLALLNQNADETRSDVCREKALEVFQRLAGGEMTEHLLDHLEEPDFNRKEIVYMILHCLGREAAEPIIGRIVATQDPYSRKSLTTALLRIGSPVIKPLLALLADGRRQYVRTAVSLLGETGNREAVRGLTMTAYHADNRIRFETISALARIGGKEATEVLTDLLHDSSRAIRRQSVLWLGITRNERAVQPLVNLLFKRDLAGKSFTLKKEVLLAIGRIGDRRALEPLFQVVGKRHWLSPGKWEELKLIAVEAIGRLGGDSARAFLQKASGRGGRIGRACQAALETMEDKAGDNRE